MIKEIIQANKILNANKGFIKADFITDLKSFLNDLSDTRGTLSVYTSDLYDYYDKAQKLLDKEDIKGLVSLAEECRTAFRYIYEDAERSIKVAKDYIKKNKGLRFEADLEYVIQEFETIIDYYHDHVPYEHAKSYYDGLFGGLGGKNNSKAKKFMKEMSMDDWYSHFEDCKELRMSIENSYMDLHIWFEAISNACADEYDVQTAL